MANTKFTKRKEEGDTQQVKSGSNLESELPQNQGNGDLVNDQSPVDDLSHVHDKCDNLMAKLKALNQAAVNMPTASVVSTSPFITPIVMPVHTDVCTEVRDTENLSEVAAAADAVLEGLINYLTNPIAVETVATNIGSEVDLDVQFSDKENEAVQPIKATVIILNNQSESQYQKKAFTSP